MIQFYVQSDDGTVANANAYIDTTEFDQYWENHGEIYSQDESDKQVAIIRGTEYVDQRFTYEGYQLTQGQSTEWPRSGATDCRLDDATGVPDAIKEATAEYAGRYIDNSALQSDITDVDALTGRTTMENVGPIEARYADGIGSVGQFPFYPTADQIIKSSCLTVNVSRVNRV